VRIAVIGTGNIGGTLARKWAAAGHTVILGVRDPASARVQDLISGAAGGTSVESIADAAKAADVSVFAVPGAAMGEMVRSLAADLGGKIVVDATNNMAGGPLNAFAHIAGHAPTALAVRAFNSLGWENFAEPDFGGVPADLFFCGPDGEPRNTVEGLIRDVGLGPVYVGGVDQVEVVDSVTRLWFALVFGQKRPRHLAFKVLTD
jgi:8-hydroxy-5-deazaflavin:NADPH oxidoreductase